MSVNTLPASLNSLAGIAGRVVTPDDPAYDKTRSVFYGGIDKRPSARRKWVGEVAETLQPRDEGAYVGFLTDDGEARIRSAYPGVTWDRLTRVKSTYDPTNVFRLNQNISPASAGAN